MVFTNLGQAIADFLRNHAEEKFTARQIAQWIYETYPEKCEEKLTKSNVLKSKTDLLNQFVAEISGKKQIYQKKYPQIKIIYTQPYQYYWTEKSEENEIIEAERTEKTASHQTPKEKDLYPFLSEYLWSQGMYPKRINEKKSSNIKGPKGNKWLYPDMVAMEDLTSAWSEEIKKTVTQYSDKKAKLWSFEIKTLINNSNIRETFFQTVSNSSWANFAYLVAEQINDKTMPELRMLSALHGVGLISLNIKIPTESQIVIPARERFDVDWTACNRIAEENKDFLNFVSLVLQFHQTGILKSHDWDYVPISNTDE